MFTIELRQDRPIPIRMALELADGELHALVGPSGAGKSTCLRAIAGLLPGMQGRIAAGDAAWMDSGTGLDLKPHRRAAGMLFQSYALFPHMTALANVASAASHLPRSRRQAYARELLARVRLEGLEDRRPGKLSGGQQQRVAMARALARRPRILLLDEPFAAVDQRTRQRLYRELALLRRELSVPILLVTHDLSEARMLADRMTVLYRGSALATGTPETLMNRPPNVQTARLLGQRNLFQGQIAGSGHLQWGGHNLSIGVDHRCPSGTKVSWLIPASSVLLHRRDRPSRGELENPVPGRITEALPLGEQLHCLLKPEHGPEIAFTLSSHAARRNGIGPGVEAVVSLLADGIHLMPGER